MSHSKSQCEGVFPDGSQAGISTDDLRKLLKRSAARPAAMRAAAVRAAAGVRAVRTSAAPARTAAAIRTPSAIVAGAATSGRGCGVVGGSGVIARRFRRSSRRLRTGRRIIRVSRGPVRRGSLLHYGVMEVEGRPARGTLGILERLRTGGGPAASRISRLTRPSGRALLRGEAQPTAAGVRRGGTGSRRAACGAIGFERTKTTARRSLDRLRPALRSCILPGERRARLISRSGWGFTAGAAA